MALRSHLLSHFSLVLALFTLLLLSTAESKAPGTAPSAAVAADEEEDLSFLDAEDGEGFSSDGYYRRYGSYEVAVDEKDVVVLTEKNFTGFIEGNRHVMVDFYAPWCGHCQELAREYAAAATALKDSGEEVVLAKVDAAQENELGRKYQIQGFPTLLFFVDGVHKPCSGHSTKDAIVSWIRKKIRPALQNLTTLEEAEKVLSTENKLVLGFLDMLVGPESQELAAAATLNDDVSFYQTTNADVAKLFHMDSNVKRPSLVLLKKEAEKLAYFDGDFTKSMIVEFVSANKLPIVFMFNRETASLIFESEIKKQVLLFATSKSFNSALPIFQEVAKSFKGKILFVYVEIDNEDVAKPVSDFFGVTGDGPTIFAYSGNEDGKKYLLDGEVTIESIKAFVKGFLEDKLKPFYKSDPLPASNDGDVKIVVGNNFQEIVLDQSKDVLLEVYAPWCGHCHALEPIYNKLAKHLRGIDSLTIAKMDGITNEHPLVKIDGFPTLLFFPAGDKSADPLAVETERTVVAFYKFLRKHASIPFKIQNPATSTKSDGSVVEGKNETTEGAKDEL